MYNIQYTQNDKIKYCCVRLYSVSHAVKIVQLNLVSDYLLLFNMTLETSIWKNNSGMERTEMWEWNGLIKTASNVQFFSTIFSHLYHIINFKWGHSDVSCSRILHYFSNGFSFFFILIHLCRSFSKYALFRYFNEFLSTQCISDDVLLTIQIH